MWWLPLLWVLSGQLFWTFVMCIMEDDETPSRVAIAALFACWVCGPFMWWWTYNKAYNGSYTGFGRGGYNANI